MQTPDFDERLEELLAKDARYHREAYHFIREGLDWAVRQVSKGGKAGVRHVTPQELALGLKDYGLRQFGPLAATVLEEWGVKSCEDFGELVFNLVDYGLLSKTEADTREAFKDVYNFDDAFRRPFLPAAKAAPVPALEVNEKKG